MYLESLLRDGNCEGAFPSHVISNKCTTCAQSKENWREKVRIECSFDLANAMSGLNLKVTFFVFCHLQSDH